MRGARIIGHPDFEFGVVEWCMAVAVVGIAITFAVQVTGCTAAQKRTARSINDVADQACELFATEQAELAGLNLADIANAVSLACDGKDSNRGILDALLAAQREGAAERAGLMGLPASDAD